MAEAIRSEDFPAGCYICGSPDFIYRPGRVRDDPELKICQCRGCGLVYLASFAAGRTGFYEDSGMHGEQPVEVAKWLAEGEADDERRYRFLKGAMAGKRLLDFGCGAGGFLMKARAGAAEVRGVELERRLSDHFSEHGLRVAGALDALVDEGAVFDLITMFHVLEHLPDPRGKLRELARLIAPGGEIIVEVPSADDALLTLYGSEAFSRFTYWSCHLFLFDPHTLAMLAEQAELRVNYIKQVQRYPLSNHLYWLAKGKPGGHKAWNFLDSPGVRDAYENTLASIGKCDTLIMSVSLA